MCFASDQVFASRQSVPQGNNNTGGPSVGSRANESFLKNLLTFKMLQ